MSYGLFLKVWTLRGFKGFVGALREWGGGGSYEVFHRVYFEKSPYVCTSRIWKGYTLQHKMGNAATLHAYLWNPEGGSYML